MLGPLPSIKKKNEHSHFDENILATDGNLYSCAALEEAED